MPLNPNIQVLCEECWDIAWHLLSLARSRDMEAPQTSATYHYSQHEPSGIYQLPHARGHPAGHPNHYPGTGGAGHRYHHLYQSGAPAGESKTGWGVRTFSNTDCCCTSLPCLHTFHNSLCIAFCADQSRTYSGRPWPT